MTLVRTSLACIAIYFASPVASATADARVALERPRLTPPAVLQAHVVAQSVAQLQEGVLSRALPSDYGRSVRRAGRGRLLLGAGIPLLVFGTPLAAWAATKTPDNCYVDDLNGLVMTGSVMAWTGLMLTSAGIAHLVRAGKEVRRDRKPQRHRRWALPLVVISGVLSTGVFAGGFFGGTVACAI